MKKFFREPKNTLKLRKSLSFFFNYYLNTLPLLLLRLSKTDRREEEQYQHLRVEPIHDDISSVLVQTDPNSVRTVRCVDDNARQRAPRKYITLFC